MRATSTSNATNPAANNATFCLRNLRQNSVQGVRTASLTVGAGAVTRTSSVAVSIDLSITNRRIDDAVEYVDDQVDQDELEREQEHERLNHFVVAHVDGIDQQAAETGPIEYLLDDDRAAKQEAELKPHHRDDGNQRVAHAVLGDDARFIEPLGACRANVVFAQNVDER